jgi:5-methylcytosine-specific restriction endonuclease McrA
MTPKARQNKVYQAQQMAKGNCVTCWKPNPRKGLRECGPCAARSTKRAKARDERYKKEGCCRTCGQTEGLLFSTVTNFTHEQSRITCPDCWYRRIANSHGMSTKDWPVLRDLLVAQNRRCAYSRDVLVLGQNMSLDHKTPTSRGGGNEPSNLQWVTWRVNLMKSDMTHEEFLHMCRRIADQAQG